MRVLRFYLKQLVTVFICVLLVSCSGTTLMGSWVDDNVKSYNHPMIIGISDSQQNRQIYEKYFVAELKKHNISATPSYKLISSKEKMNRETVLAALASSDIPIDSVLVTYLVSADAEVNFRESPLSGGYSDSADTIQMSATIISTRGRTSSTEIFVLKNDLYDAESREIVWSAQTKTVAPESIDAVVQDVVEMLVDEMLSDKILKQ